MTKRKGGDVLVDEDDRIQERLASTSTAEDDVGGSLIRGDSIDGEEEIHGSPSTSMKSFSGNSSDEDDVDDWRVSSSVEERHRRTAKAHKTGSDGGGMLGQTQGGPPTAFGRAFGKIMAKKMPRLDMVDISGPILVERKSLLLQKLESKDADRKAKLRSKEDTRQIREKGHVLPPAYTDGKEKALIRTATKGVVRLFNAISKAQKVQSGTDMMSKKDANAALNQTKATFLTELKKADVAPRSVTDLKDERQESQQDWSVLKPNFMLGGSLKNAAGWDRSLINVDSEGHI